MRRIIDSILLGIGVGLFTSGADLPFICAIGLAVMGAVFIRPESERTK